jgi:hypothetical protein
MIACRTDKWLWSLVNAVDVGAWQRICKRPENHGKEQNGATIGMNGIDFVVFFSRLNKKTSPFINKENANEWYRERGTKIRKGP